jgi:hypothetical protein
LIAAVKDVFPHIERRECFMHLIQNYIKDFTGKEHMYSAARAYRKEVYEHHKVNVVGIDGVAPWLKSHYSLLWYRSDFNPNIKCDYITNNIAEVFNNWTKGIKDLPVCQLVDKMRVMVMELFFEEVDWREFSWNDSSLYHQHIEGTY